MWAVRLILTRKKRKISNERIERGFLAMVDDGGENLIVEGTNKISSIIYCLKHDWK